MKKLNEFIEKHYQKIAFFFMFVIFVNTCGNPVKPLSKKVDRLSNKIDSLELIIVTHEDLKIEGLHSEKRMIQSTDRRILDVNRQSEIDKEITELEK